MAIWTARTALSRGRNPWVWGGAALLLGLMPGAVSLLSVGPLVILLFLPRYISETPAQPERPACPKCTQTRRPNQHFCTNCGWDLSQPLEQDGSDSVVAAQELSQKPNAPVVGSKPSGEPVIAQITETQAIEALDIPESVERMDAQLTDDVGALSESLPADKTAGSEFEAGPEPISQPWGMPKPGIAPTAATMTARGVSRLDDNRIQEAIDQFTKAIALDPNYREAWELRAEAYAKQGRGEEADEDRRRLQGLDTSSSTG